MYKYLLLTLLCSCGSFGQQALEDFIQGEAQVAEKVIQDVSGKPTRARPTPSLIPAR